MMCHGYTHQYSNVENPYSGSTGDDCEFYRITMNSDNTLNFQGPVAEDSLAWAQARFASAQALYIKAGFPMPAIMTFPSYAASAVDYQAANGFFTAASERRLYFTGLLSGQPINYAQVAGQYMPYTVHDVYKMKVLADTLGWHRAATVLFVSGSVARRHHRRCATKPSSPGRVGELLLPYLRQRQLSPADCHSG